MIKSPKKITLSPKDFRVGFELEFKSRELTRKYGSSWNFSNGSCNKPKIKLPHKSMEKIGRIGGDGDLWELRTKPICFTKAKEYLKEAFSILRHFNASTNKNCGLHINVSCKKKKFHTNLNPITLSTILDTAKLAKKFGRAKTRACLSPTKNKPYSSFDFYAQKIVDWEKNFAINFQNYKANPQKSSRIEFRVPGGKDYHKKEKLCVDTLNTIVKGLSQSYRN
jgi:hypothetical protein